MSDDLKKSINQTWFDLLSDNSEQRKAESISQKRREAGKKGGNAPHRCRGRGCNKNKETESTNDAT